MPELNFFQDVPPLILLKMPLPLVPAKRVAGDLGFTARAVMYASTLSPELTFFQLVPPFVVL